MKQLAFVIILLFSFHVAGAQTPTRLRLKQLELAPDSTGYVIMSDSNRVAYWENLTTFDTSITNEIQQIDTLSLSGTTLSASLSSDGAAAKTVNLSPILSGYVTGSGTAGRVPRWTSSSALGDGVLRDDGSLLAIGGATVTGYSLYDYSTSTWKLPTRTTAQRPTGVTGGFGYNTTLAYGETYNGSVWLQSDFPAGTNTYTLRHDGTSWVATSLLKVTASVVQINSTATGKTLNVGGNMYLSDGNSNTFIQGQIGANPQNGNHNVAIGFNAAIGLQTGGEQNVMLGRNAGLGITTGDNNFMVGFNAGTKFTTGVGNIAIGHESVNGSASAATGSYNFCMSYRAGYTLTSGTGNFFLGPYTGGSTTTGSYNLYLGYYAGATGTATGDNNTGVGRESLQNVSDAAGSYATALGYRSGYNSSEVDNNIFIGREAGQNNTYSNVAVIGYESTASQNSQIAIGTGTNYTQLKARNYAFNIDQTVGAGQDGYALKYNHSTGEIELASVGTGTVTGSGTTDYIPKFTSSTALGNSVLQESSSKIGIGVTPAHTLDMESATDAIDLPGGTTAQRPTNESELLRYNSDNARVEYADGTNWRNLLPSTSTTGSAILPAGTTGERDGSPSNGFIRYNSTTGQLEAYVQSAWANISASPRSYADMVSSGAAQYTVVSTEVIDTVTNIVASGFTHSNGVLTYTGTTNKNFLVNISAVVGEADTDAATAVLRLYQDSSIKGVSQMYCALQDEKYSMSISRIVTLATNDTLGCRLATGGDWIVSNFYFNVTPID